MSLYKSPLQMVVDSINRLNKLDLVADEYNFGAPVALATPRGLINTEIEISAKGPNSAFSGSVVVGYHRLALAELADQVSLVVPVMEVNTTLDVALAINRNFGTVFTAADIVVRDLTTEEKVIPGTIVLEASVTGYGWIGSVEVGTRAGGYSLPTYLTNRALVGMNYPTPVTTRPYAHMYSYWRDCSDQYDRLSTVQVGVGQLEAIRDALIDITGDAWVVSGTGRYTLDGATVTDVAVPREVEDYNSRYDHAIKVLLNDATSLGLTGSLVLHFNEPLDI